MSNLTPLLAVYPPRSVAQAGDQYAADIIRGLSEELATSETAADFLETTHPTWKRPTRPRTPPTFCGWPWIVSLWDATAPARPCTSCTAATAAAKPTACCCWPPPPNTPTCPTGRRPMRPGFRQGDGLRRRKAKRRQRHCARRSRQPRRKFAGYLLYHLGGPAALNEFGEGDATLTDPGSETF